jgi:hypothetical protein
MKWLALMAAGVAGLASAGLAPACLEWAGAFAQARVSVPSPPPVRPAVNAPPSMGNAASVRTHLEALHYQGVQDLRRGPDGQWTATARQQNVPKTVTVAPDGTVTAR